MIGVLWLVMGVIPLGEAGKSKSVGGKAASLARLIGGGFRVPPGFVVYDELDSSEILDAFDKLGAKFVAVRSSAASEDGAKDAWAGQLDTFLNVGREDLLDKIGACFDSAGSQRAQAYARQKNINAGQVAVIVQKMVPAEASGVAFSVHPVTNAKSKMVIESVKGLGEKLVSGQVTPNTYVIDKQTGKVAEKHSYNEKYGLADQQLKELVQAVAKIETLFGFPVDVEWTFADKELFILQSRPITTLD